MESTYEQILEEAQERKVYLKRFCEELFLGKRVTLEIGCGHGHFLTAYAEAYPEKICIGIDVCTQRILRGKKKQDRAKLSNLYFIKADAVEFLEALPEGVLIDEIYILFPDPWPKTRHYKHRLIQEEFLELLFSKSLVGSRIHFRTDHEGYFDWALREIRKSRFWELMETEEPWSFEQETVFQKRAEKYQSFIASNRGFKGLI